VTDKLRLRNINESNLSVKRGTRTSFKAYQKGQFKTAYEIFGYL